MRSNVVFRPTVIIGLGGTGYGAILKLKTKFIEADGSVPPIIRFLAIDTTENVEHTAKTREGIPVELDPNEKFVLSVANPGALINGNNEHIDDWWPRNIPTKAITDGAGQVRARGRLALFAKSREIFAQIRKAVDDVMQIKMSKQMYAERFRISNKGGVEVYIVGSLAGGTGSGMFLDVAFIARSFLDSLSNITGVLALPRVFIGRPGTSLVQSNAYGALKEIEKFSRLNVNDGFNINYGTSEVQVTQPPFNLLYLIDGINEAGKVITEPNDLLDLVASGLYIQIGSQMGTDSKNTVDNIKTHLATVESVRGRSPSYCSFGVASLTLPVREYETMKVDAMRKLLSDGLMNGAFSDSELEDEVVRLIEDHKLREDDADEVIDALSEQEGGGQIRSRMQLGQMRFDKNAPTTIKDLHVTHRSRMERQVAQGIETNYKRLLEQSSHAINEWWERALNRPNGLTYAMRFAEKLRAKLEWYQHMMENESKDEQDRHKALNFNILEEQIREATGKWIKTERHVRTACENYKGLVDRECELHLQVTRRDKAAELYGVLRAQVEDILRRCEVIRRSLEAVKDGFEQLYLDVSTNRGGESPFEHTLRFDVEANRPEIKTEDFIRWYGEQHGSLTAWAGMRAEDVAREISSFVNERYRPLTQMPIDDVLRRSDIEEITQDLTQLSNLAVPLWRYDPGRIPVVNQNIIDELFHYGVADVSKTILKDPKIGSKVPHGSTQPEPSFVSTDDAQRITLFKVKVGVPLFALQDIEDMERAYNAPGKEISNHLNAEWESFPNVIPRGGEGDALRWFAIAQAPDPFAMIARRGDWYYIKSKLGKKTSNGEIRLGQGRLNAYSAFEKKRELIKEVEETVDLITQNEGVAKTSTVLREYSTQLVKQVSGGNVETSIKEQVEGEIEAIEDYLSRMSKLR